MGRVMDKLKDDLESIVEQPELIHYEDFMMGLMKRWENELPDFDKYIKHQYEVKKQRLVVENS